MNHSAVTYVSKEQTIRRIKSPERQRKLGWKGKKKKRIGKKKKKKRMKKKKKKKKMKAAQAPIPSPWSPMEL